MTVHFFQYFVLWFFTVFLNIESRCVTIWAECALSKQYQLICATKLYNKSVNLQMNKILEKGYMSSTLYCNFHRHFLQCAWDGAGTNLSYRKGSPSHLHAEVIRVFRMPVHVCNLNVTSIPSLQNVQMYGYIIVVHTLLYGVSSVGLTKASEKTVGKHVVCASQQRLQLQQFQHRPQQR
jgi:hypothetical protein